MFWEMDAEGHRAALGSISDFLLSVFAFAASKEDGGFQRKEWLDYAGAQDGEWFYELYVRDTKNGQSMREALDELFGMDRARREAIHEAIRHDMGFANFHGAEFAFWTTDLPAKERKVIRDFYLYFYQVVLCTAHFRLHGITGPYGRGQFAQQFFERAKNRTIRRVCPVCLQTMTDGMEEGEVEHYFAKSAVPCLALHPFNLYFCCPTCNKRYKGDKSPFSSGKKELKRIFLPYLDTVRDQVRIGFEMDKKAGEEKVRLDPVDPKEEHIREKIRAFDHLFDLKKRWSGQLEGYYMEKMQWYRRKNPETVEALRAEMEEDIERGKSSLNISPRGYLETEYLEWLCSSQLKAFYSNMKQTDRTPVILGRTDS